MIFSLTQLSFTSRKEAGFSCKRTLEPPIFVLTDFPDV